MWRTIRDRAREVKNSQNSKAFLCQSRDWRILSRTVTCISFLTCIYYPFSTVPSTFFLFGMYNNIFFLFFLLLCYYSCPKFSPFALLHPAHPCSHSQSPHCCPCQKSVKGIIGCSCMFLTSPFPFFPPLFPSSLPSGCSLSVPCFHVSGSIFSHYFILFIRYLL